jgi:hypothetical protein
MGLVVGWRGGGPVVSEGKIVERGLGVVERLPRHLSERSCRVANHPKLFPKLASGVLLLLLRRFTAALWVLSLLQLFLVQILLWCDRETGSQRVRGGQSMVEGSAVLMSLSER